MRYAARSQWTEPTFGQTTEVNRRLREGASEEELFGALAKTPEQLWNERRELNLAASLESDTKNEALFAFILPYAQAEDYEDWSKNVWRTDKSKLELKSSEIAEKNPGLLILHQFGNAQVQADAYLLHAALLAKAAGHDALQFRYVDDKYNYAMVRFGDFGDGSNLEPLYLDADAVIANLREIIPDPAERRLRKDARR